MCVEHVEPWGTTVTAFRLAQPGRGPTYSPRAVETRSQGGPQGLSLGRASGITAGRSVSRATHPQSVRSARPLLQRLCRVWTLLGCSQDLQLRG